jgi:hemolysin D
MPDSSKGHLTSAADPNSPSAGQPSHSGAATDLTTRAQDDWSYATQALLDSMPRVWTRGLFYLLLLFAGVVIPWAALFRVDETGTARGRLEPQGQTLRLDSQASGAIAAIQVKEGDRVQAGQPLMVLDAELLTVELQQNQNRLEGLQDQLTQLSFLRQQMASGLATQHRQNQSQAMEKETQIDQAAQQIEYARTEQALTDRNLASAAREMLRYQTLYRQGIIPETEAVKYQESFFERQLVYQQAQANVVQANLKLKENAQSYESLLHSGKLSLLQMVEEIQNLETQMSQTASEMTQSERAIQALQVQLRQRAITAPVSGVIFELPFQQIGSMVQPGSKVAEIAPDNAGMIISAEISTVESGSLKPGLPVKVKFDAYPFQDYGVIEGILTSISPTSQVEATPQGNVTIYKLEVKLNQSCLSSSQGCIELRPGDTATVEVVTRQRRIIDIVLDPFKKLSADGLDL